MVGLIVEVSISICFLFVEFCGVRSGDANYCVKEIDFFIRILAFEFDRSVVRVDSCKEVF